MEVHKLKTLLGGSLIKWQSAPRLNQPKGHFSVNKGSPLDWLTLQVLSRVPGRHVLQNITNAKNFTFNKPLSDFTKKQPSFDSIQSPLHSPLCHQIISFSCHSCLCPQSTFITCSCASIQRTPTWRGEKTADHQWTDRSARLPLSGLQSCVSVSLHCPKCLPLHFTKLPQLTLHQETVEPTSG